MKYLCSFLLLIGITFFPIFSQSSKITIRSGSGYYLDTFSCDDGPIIWIEGGYKFKTDFNMNARLSMTYLDWIINSGQFKDYRTISLRHMIDITFSRALNVGGNNFIEPGLGFKLKKEFLLKPDITEIYNSGNYTILTRYSDRFYEIGFTIVLDYYHQFSNNVFLGLRTDTNIIWALGFEGLTVSPLLGFRF